MGRRKLISAAEPNRQAANQSGLMWASPIFMTGQLPPQMTTAPINGRKERNPAVAGAREVALDGAVADMRSERDRLRKVYDSSPGISNRIALLQSFNTA